MVHKGPYALAAALQELESWARGKGLSVVGAPVLIYLSNPGGMAASQREWEIQAAVDGEAVTANGPEAQGPGVKDLPPREALCTRNRGGYTAIEPLLPALFQVVYDRGYRLAGPAEEVYPRDFAGKTLAELQTEVRFPVVRRQGEH
jgi:effector-binding domain-containing protein